MSDHRKKSGILNFSLKQVLAWINKEWSLDNERPLTGKMVGNRRYLRQLEASLDRETYAKDKTKVQYPLLNSAIVEMSLDEELGALKKNRATKGYITKRDVTTGKFTMEDLRRIRVGLGFYFKSDSMDDMISLAHILLYNAPRVGFVMKGEEGFVVETSITIDNSISMVETADDAGEYYEYEFVIILKTYLGYVEEHRMIRNIVFNTTEADNEEVFFKGSPYMDLSQTINYTDYFNKESAKFRG